MPDGHQELHLDSGGGSGFHSKYDATRQNGQVLGSYVTIVFAKENKR